MNCIHTVDNFLNSRYDNAEELLRIRKQQDDKLNEYVAVNDRITPHQESLHSYRFSKPNTTSHGLAVAMSKDNNKMRNIGEQTTLSLINKEHATPQPQSFSEITNQLELIDMSTSPSPDDSSNPVTPEDREPLSAVKRSISISTSSSNYRRHRTALVSNSLYPTTSTTTSSISRYLPQNQAVITTQDNWRISLSNHIATLVLSGSNENNNQDFIGKHILDFIDVTHRPLLLDKIYKSRENHRRSDSKGRVLICGDVIPIIKQDGTKSTASLWLKEKKSEDGPSIFIWIFEEVFQSTIRIMLDEQNEHITNLDNGVFELFGYTATELMHQKIYPILLPKFDHEHSFFGARTKYNVNFPVMIKRVFESNMIRLTSMPTLSGLITVGKDNTIQSYNAAFAKYLFGYGHNLIDENISLLIPAFPFLITCLQRDDLLKHDFTLNSFICRKVLHAYNREENITAMHRDGTLFDIDLQIKLLEENSYALWLTFDRESVFSRAGHATATTTTPSQKIQQKDSHELSSLNSSIARSKSVSLPISKSTQQTIPEKKKKSINPLNNNLKVANQPTVATAKITSFSRPSFTSSKSAMEATKQQIINSTWPRIGEYSAQTLKTNINDYEIIDELGQGAYGLVKLACMKNDPEKKRVVIKYVIKSRILVDCWTRDRKLGLVPAEIHVLHTLRKIPHVNCSDMLDYFEDDDIYYIVMDLYGAGMDLFDYIELKNGMGEEEIRSIFRQVVAAVAHLHDHRIVHRDIKDENVILDLKGGVRLIDFGSAAYMKPGKKYDTFVGTLDYAAPEILKGQAYEGPPQDIWACGTLLYTLIYRENPFYNIDEIMEHELRLPFILSDDSVDLMRKMLDRNVDTRLNIHQVLEHPWFQSK